MIIVSFMIPNISRRDGEISIGGSSFSQTVDEYIIPNVNLKF